MKASELMAKRFPSPGEAWFVIAESIELVNDGDCTPACLFARSEDGSCQCRCDEAFHGALQQYVKDTVPEMAFQGWVRHMRDLMETA